MASFLAGGVAAAGVLVGGGEQLQIMDEKGNTLVLFDASLDENYTTEVTPTEFPVEGGAIISDHLIRKPFELPFKGIISDHPLGTEGANLAEGATVAASALLPPLGVAAAGLAYGLYQADSGDPTPSRAAYDTLVRLQLGDEANKKGPKVLTVKSKMGTFKSMVIKTLSAPRSASSGSAIEFAITFARITIVTPQSVNVGKFDNPGLAAGRADVGDQNAFEDRFTPGRIAGKAAVGAGG